MDHTFKGLILKSIDFHEADKLLTILTLEKGKIQVRARGVKKSTSKFGAFCQSFCFGEFELIDGKAGYVLSGINCIDSFFEMTQNLDKFSYAFAVLEILDKITVENEVYPSLFIEALKCIKSINYSTIDPRMLLSKFIILALKLEGFRLNLTACARCKTPFMSNPYLELPTGEILCVACRTFESIEIERSVFSAFKMLYENDYDKLSTIKLSRNILDKTLFALTQNLSYKYEIKLNSLKL